MRCKICHKDGEFYPYNQTTCKKCIQARSAKHINQHGNKWRDSAKFKIWRHDKDGSVEGRVRALISGARVRARRANLACDIVLGDLYPYPSHCSILGIELDYGMKGRRTPTSASIDRINSKLGYTKGNVRIISWRANDVRGDASTEELVAVAADAVKQEEARHG
jgi:hypothetical protein